jgi:hypothetical protein
MGRRPPTIRPWRVLLPLGVLAVLLEGAIALQAGPLALAITLTGLAGWVLCRP